MWVVTAVDIEKMVMAGSESNKVLDILTVCSEDGIQVGGSTTADKIAKEINRELEDYYGRSFNTVVTAEEIGMLFGKGYLRVDGD